ncbi:ADP-ribosylhydrolase ARH1-like [Dreissena polymorpha]|uniref:ADP-ribosylhydrolase ARH1 n=1 Tax=Dreissena polymorpha TaxID=45954 RepID=A0A9D4LR80_DREPO|nr:ADP-ribosylhydrolase ARH1-like [Dreissena polymorpha]KAH3863497.1 hypothetical protein DPMN_026486 [Dreissena polymorpha]
MGGNAVVRKTEARMMQRYEAAMVLGAVGDALGYFHGRWEFERSGKKINEELNAMGGLEKLKVSGQKWIVSDDTVMHIATGKALVQHGLGGNFDELYKKIATQYKACMMDMKDRAPGQTCIQWCEYIDPNKPEGWRIPFNPRGGGCGAAMRAMCIGLRYPNPDEKEALIKVSIEAGRMTHHHPTGYLGSLASAMFMSYAIQRKPVREWGAALMKVVEIAREYIINEGDYIDDNLEHWFYFTSRWNEYLHMRAIADEKSEPVFPENYETDVTKRDQFYSEISYGGWGGSSGHDAPLIAYDAVLACHGDWTTLCEWAMFHGGDSDSTGIIAGCLFGALYGFDGVPDGNHSDVEKRAELVEIGVQLSYLAIGETSVFRWIHDMFFLLPSKLFSFLRWIYDIFCLFSSKLLNLIKFCVGKVVGGTRLIFGGLRRIFGGLS